MLTVCSLGCSERGFKSHWLPLHLTLLVQPTLKTNTSQQQQHKWSHCCTFSKYAWVSQPFHVITPCWFSTQKAQLVLFKCNSGGRISLTSKLHNMCIYIYSNIRLQIVPFFPVSAALSVQSQSTEIRWVDQKAVCIWENRTVMCHQGR